MSSITYRIATGAQAGRKVATLQTIAADNGSSEGDAGKVGGFSLHAGVAADAHEGQKLERLCRYIARPAISEKRLSISPQGTALPAQDAVAKRHDARGVRAGGIHRQTRGPGAAAAGAPDPLPQRLYSGHPALRPPPSALRATLRLFKFAPGEFVRQTRSCARSGRHRGAARWSQRTTGRQRAHGPLWPRDTPPATKPVLSAVEGPKAKQGKTTRSGNEPAGPCSARCR